MLILPFKITSDIIIIIIFLIILIFIWVNQTSSNITSNNIPFKKKISNLTLENTNYRQVINTTNNTQIILMSLLPSQETGLKNYKHNTQVIHTEQAEATIMINQDHIKVSENDLLVIPSDTIHNIKNTSTFQKLQLYIIYSSPILPPNTIQPTKSIDN